MFSDAPRYKNFYRQEEQDDEVAYKLAQFSRDNNPQYRSSTPQHQPSDDELPVLPTQGRRHEERPMTGMSRHEDRPMTGMSRHEDRPMTGMSRRDDSSPVRPPTGYPRLEDRPPTGYPRLEDRPATGISPATQRSQDPRGSGSRGRPATMQSMHDDSPPSSHRSRSRGGSQSPLKGIINEYPPEGITQFCRQDSGSMRHGGRPTSSRHSSSSSVLSASEAPTNSTSEPTAFQTNSPTKSMGPPSPKVLQRRDKSSVDLATSPGKKSSFWNFGSKSPKQGTPKATPPTSPLKSSKSAPSGMAISVPNLDIASAGPQRRDPGNRSRRERSEEPIAHGASVMLNIGNNVLEVNNPDARNPTKYEEPVDTTDPLMAALEDLKIASKTPRMSSSPTKRSSVDTQQADSPIYQPYRPPSRQDVNMSSMRSSTSQNLRTSQQSQTPPSRGNPSSQTPSRSTPPPIYDTRRNTLGAPPPAHSAAEMERTRRQFATQVQQVLGTGPTARPGTSQIPPRSTSPRPMSRQSQFEDDSYSGRPGSSMSMNRQDLPPRTRSPGPQQRGQYQQDVPARSRSPAPGRPMSRQEMEYTRPTSRQDYDHRRTASPAPYQSQQRGMYVDDALRRSPSPQPYTRAPSPGPVAGRPRSSAAGVASNPFGISIDRFGNVVDANGRSASPQPHPSSRQQYAYGSSHRHDIDGVLDPLSRYPPVAQNVSPAHARARSKSQSDVRARGNYTEDGRLVLFPGMLFNFGGVNEISESVV